MSLCSLIYRYKQVINSPNDLIAIMDIGNQLYSSLSRLASQTYLLQTELPTMLNVFEADYQLHYSESYTGTVHQDTTIEGYEYCTSLYRAFDSLISQDYNNFILTVGSIGVAIYRDGNAGFKIFDSHARDLCGRAHPEGTCVLLELPSLDSLLQYLKSIHSINDIFEVKGVKIAQAPNSIIPCNSTIEAKPNQSGAVAMYAICYSIMKSPSYWNSKTLSSIVECGKALGSVSFNGNDSTDDLPKTIEVCGTEISLDVLTEICSTLSDSLQSRSILEDAIIRNNDCTGFFNVV